MDQAEAQQKFQLVSRLWKEQKFEAALGELNALHRAFPGNKDLVLHKARCLAAVGQVDDALDLCEHLHEELGDPRGAELAEALMRQFPESSKAQQAAAAVRQARQTIASRIGCRTVAFGMVATAVLMIFGFYFLLVRPYFNRILEFPPDAAAGVLYQRVPGDGDGAWVEVGSAQGKVVISRDLELRIVLLTADPSSPVDLSYFANFGANDIREIDASAITLREGGLAPIAGMRGLRVLNLHGSNIGTSDLFPIGKLTQLETLILSNNRVNDGALTLLENYQALETLDIRNTNIGNAGISYLRHLDKLRYLYLPEGITDGAMEDVGAHEALVELSLNRTQVGDEGLVQLANLGQLRSLDLGTTLVTDSGLKHLIALSNLEVLNLAHARIGDAGLVYLKRLPSLRELSLAGTPISDKALPDLADIPALERLDLGSCCERPRVSPAGLSVFSEAPVLQFIDLSGSPRSEADQSAIAAALPGVNIDFKGDDGAGLAFNNDKSLGMIWIREGSGGDSASWVRYGKAQGLLTPPAGSLLRLDVSAEGVHDLQSFPSERRGDLRSLRFEAGSALESSVFEFIGRLAGLEELDLTDTSYDDASLSAIGALTRLRTFRAADSSLTAAGLEVLRGLGALREVDLSGTAVGGEGGAVLASLTSLENLNLRGSRFADEGVRALEGLPTLRSVDLSQTAVTPSAAARLRQALPNAVVLFPDAESRTLNFPVDRSLGTLWTRPAGSTRGVEWVQFGPAQGPVSVPGDVELRLDVSAQAASNLSALIDLAGEDFHTLRLSDVRVAEDQAAGLRAFSGLRTLDLFGSAMSDTALTFLSALSELRSLRLNGTGLTDEGLVNIRALKNLEELDLASTAITDAGLDRLSAVSSLRRVYLDDSHVTEQGVAAARNSLPSCEFIFSREEDAEASVPPRFKPARILDVPAGRSLGTLWMRDRDSLADEDWEGLGGLSCSIPIPTSKMLKLRISPREAQDLSLLASFAPDTFQALEFERDTRITATMLAEAAHLRNVEELLLDFTVIEEGALRQLERFRALRRLSLYGARIGDADLAYLRQAPWLKHLDLAATPISDEGFAHLASVGALERIDLHNNPAISDVSMILVREMKALRELNLTRTSISDRGIDLLEESESLARVEAYGTSATLHRLETLRETGTIKEVQYEHLKLNEYELEALKAPLRRAARSDEGVTAEAVIAAADVESLADIAPESLSSVQRLALSAAATSDTGITPQTIAEMAGVERYDEVPPEVLAFLQSEAFNAIAELEGEVTAESIAAIGGGRSFESLDSETLTRLQGFALEAVAMTEDGISTEDIVEVAGVDTFEEIPDVSLRALQRLSLAAMADSDTGITGDGLAEVVGADGFGGVLPQEREWLELLVMSAMSDSQTGITPQSLAEMEGVETYDQVPEERLDFFQNIGISAMAESETGIRAGSMAGLGGEIVYDGLVEDTMEKLQNMALITMANTETGITTENLTEIGGRHVYANLPGQRLETMQGYALSAMADAETGITTQVMVELSGVEYFSELGEVRLEPLQVMAFSAMADSETGITETGIAAVSGVADFAELQAEELLVVQTRMVTGMAQSETGVTAEALTRFVGNAAIERLAFADTDIGDDVIGYIQNTSALTLVDLSNCDNITDLSLSYLADAEVLETLLLSNTRITNEGLAFLAGMKSLKTLDLSGTAVDDAGLEHLESVTTLENLMLQETSIGGSGLAYLKSLPLKKLDLLRTQVADYGIEYLTDSETLEELYLGYSLVSDLGLSYLQGMTALTTLEMHECANITDEGVAYIGGLPSLARLTIHSTAVSEASSEYLANLGTLRTLYVNQATFSRDGVNALRRSMPLCDIRRIVPPEDQRVRTIIDEVELRLEDFAEVPLAALLIRFGFVGLLALSIGSAFVIPFIPYYTRIKAVDQFVEFLKSSSLFSILATRITGIFLNQGVRWFFYTFRWWLIGGIGLLLSAFIAVGLIFGFDEMLQVIQNQFPSFQF